METAKKILPTTYLFVFLGGAFVLHFLFPIKKIILFPYALSGIPLILFGIVINIWADNLFKQEKTAVKPLAKPSSLILEGPFRFTRHPMYLGFVSLLLGVAILLGSLVSFLAPIAMFITCEKVFIPYEERNLEKTFGKKYKEHKKRVRRWL